MPTFNWNIISSDSVNCFCVSNSFLIRLLKKSLSVSFRDLPYFNIDRYKCSTWDLFDITMLLNKHNADQLMAIYTNKIQLDILKVIYHPLYMLYSMNNFVTNKSKLPQDGAQLFIPYKGWWITFNIVNRLWGRQDIWWDIAWDYCKKCIRTHFIVPYTCCTFTSVYRI